MRLSLGSRSYDLATRALVMASAQRVCDIAGAVAAGADIVEVAHLQRPSTVDVAIAVAPRDVDELEAGLAAGASVVRLGLDVPAGSLRCCAKALVAVIVGPSQLAAVEAAGVGGDRIVVCDGDVSGPYPVLVDMTAPNCPLAAMAVAVIRGARIVRIGPADVRSARRVCRTLAAVMARTR